MLRIHEIKRQVGQSRDCLPQKIEKKIGLSSGTVADWRLAKESVDARDKIRVALVCSVDFSVSGISEEQVVQRAKKRGLKIGKAPDETYVPMTERPDYAVPEQNLRHRPVVVGFGPCGMFCALTLAQMGYAPIVLERGKRVEQREADVERYWKEGVLDPESNVQFGEGGAGTFSDGKLTTQIKDSRIHKVIEEMIAAGGGEELRYKQKPHVGTDVLRTVVTNIREEILRLGGDILFETKLTGLETDESGRVTGILAERRSPSDTVDIAEKLLSVGTGISPAESGSFPSNVTDLLGESKMWPSGAKVLPTGTVFLPAEVVVLALGHSARDTFQMLYEAGLFMEQKPFSMGVRIEHPQVMINRAQYGEVAVRKFSVSGQRCSASEREPSALERELPAVVQGLPAAEYKLNWRCENGRGVYTFCMCPGGRVIASASEPETVVTNGMSYRSRDLENANSGLLVDVRPEDFGSAHPLAGMEFQKRWERRAYEAGGGGGKAPAQRVEDFLNNRPTSQERGSNNSVTPSYEPGVTWTAMDQCLPEFVCDSLREALPHLGRKLKGFDGPDSVMTGIETRSSSPVRIKRDEQYQAQSEGGNVPSGIFPAGEGAGYAGGITSAAVDGIRIAEQIARTWRRMEDE